MDRNPIARMGPRTRYLLAAYLLSESSDAAEVRLEELVRTGGEDGTFGRLHLTLIQVLVSCPVSPLQALQLAREPERVWRAVLDRVAGRAPLRRLAS